MELKKDASISFDNPKADKSKKDPRFNSYKLYLSVEKAQELAAILIDKAEAGTGVRIDLHFSEGTNSHNGNKFLKAFSYIKEKGQGPVGRPGGFQAPQKFVPKDNKEATKAKLDAVRAKLAGKQIDE